ncbi:hypothetical protein FHY04_004254 [Sphingomonas sp. BK481]|nr:hypothetical protein [Sphingomonas sp. BK481]
MKATSCVVCAITSLTFCNPAFASVIASAKDLAAAQIALARSASDSGDGKVTICVVDGEASDSVENIKRPRRCRNYVRDAVGKMVAAGGFYEKPPVLEIYEPSVWTTTSRLASRLLDYVGSFVAGTPGVAPDRSSDDRTLTDIDALVMSVDAGRVKALGHVQNERSSTGLRRSVAIMTNVASSVEQAGSASLAGVAEGALQQATLPSFAPFPQSNNTPSTAHPIPTIPTVPPRTAATPPARVANGGRSSELGGSGPH